MSSPVKDQSSPPAAPPPPIPREGARPLRAPVVSVRLDRPPSTPSYYLINDIPRNTDPDKLIDSLLAPGHDEESGGIQSDVKLCLIMSASRLDDGLSVASVEFFDTPKWLQRLNNDPCGFPKKTPLGTLWKDVDTDAVDNHGRTEFSRAVAVPGGLNLYYAEMLAEFDGTDVNIQDNQGRTALHWACEMELQDMVRLCLSVPDCDVGLRDNDGLTAFDRSGNEVIRSLFYKSILEMEETHPQVALLRVLTVTSELGIDSGKPVFPGVAIFAPIEDRNLLLVDALLARGIDLTATNQDGDTALHVAAGIVDGLEITGMLLDAGSNVRAVGNDGATPLHRAAEKGGMGIAQLLIEYGADVTAKDEGGRMALQLAQKNMKGELVVFLKGVTDTELELSVVKRQEVQASLDDNESRDGESMPALRQAVLDGDIDTVRVFLELGFNKEADDGTWLAALHLAAETGQREIVEIFFAKGVKIDGVDARERTALHLAAYAGQMDVVKTLLASGAQIETIDYQGQTALHLAADTGATDTVWALLREGAAVNGVDVSKQTALHLAASKGHADVLKNLISSGADIEAVDDKYRTALHRGSFIGSIEVVRALLMSGANICARDIDGRTALHTAAFQGQIETLKTLLSSGADIRTADLTNQTALHQAAFQGHVEVVKGLLASGANIEAADNTKHTALHLAAFGGHMDLVVSLAKCGANIEAVNNIGQRALHLTVIEGHTKVVQALLDHGANIDAESPEGTALQLASEGGRMEIVEMLLASGAHTTSPRRFASSMLRRLGLGDKKQ
ncbi:hypothetical protein Q9L58_006979 [Maublancomyces gigas]|uniref:Uncharacterized protein n=1 Tax=Discina gigas TaxID=1032678 RepID=A0ABR3GDW7_9PEZI